MIWLEEAQQCYKPKPKPKPKPKLKPQSLLCKSFKAKPDGGCFWYTPKGDCFRSDFSHRYVEDKLTICPHGFPQKISGEIEAQKRDQVYWENVYKNNKPGIECKCGWKCREVAKYCEKCGEIIK